MQKNCPFRYPELAHIQDQNGDEGHVYFRVDVTFEGYSTALSLSFYCSHLCVTFIFHTIFTISVFAIIHDLFVCSVFSLSLMCVFLYLCPLLTTP